jgi:hypothetical protein
MKKPYTPPKVGTLEVDKDVMRMLATQRGFIDLFWERFQEARKEDPHVTQEEVFDALNEKYLNTIGCTRYSCFDSFRIVRDKK